MATLPAVASEHSGFTTGEPSGSTSTTTGATLVEAPDATHVTVVVRRAGEVCAFLAGVADRS